MNQRIARTASAVALCCAAGLAQAQSFTESFDDILQLPANGWNERNNSEPLGLTNYFQGNLGVFAPQASAGYLGTNFNNTSGTGTISNWMVAPVRQLENGQSFSFWTRTVDEPGWGDRLQVRMSLAGASANVGTTALDVGDFTNLLLDINPNYTLTEYPTAWTQFNVFLSGIPAPTAGRVAFRYFVENGGPTGANSDYIGIDEVVYTAAAVAVGACCRTDGSCIVTSQAVCAAQSGIYRGDNSPCATANCPQPPTGACCFPSGCQVLTQAQCAAQNGVYQGNSTNCGTTQCPITGYSESGDAGDLPQTAAVVSGSGTLLQIQGSAGAGDTDMFQINICSPGSFNASTVGGASWDTQLWLFDANGLGVTCNDDTGGLQSVLSSQFVSSRPAGVFYLAINGYNDDAMDASNQFIWSTNSPESQPDGPGAANPVRAWSGGGDSGSYTIALQGSCFVSTGPTCYANCDGSTTAPILNVNDFICFQGLYAAGNTRANCDNSTTQPILNVNDFICFQGRYAAGCP